MFASFLQPKMVLNLLKIDKKDLVEKIKKDNRSNSQIKRTLDQYQDIDYESLQSVLSDDEQNDSKPVRKSKRSNKIASKEAKNDKKQCKKEEKSEIYQYINSDFLGLLKGMSAEVKKAKVLEIYRYFFRFCIEKMKSFVENPILMLITL